jgi:hypothetical protein
MSGTKVRPSSTFCQRNAPGSQADSQPVELPSDVPSVEPVEGPDDVVPAVDVPVASDPEVAEVAEVAVVAPTVVPTVALVSLSVSTVAGGTEMHPVMSSNAPADPRPMGIIVPPGPLVRENRGPGGGAVTRVRR